MRANSSLFSSDIEFFVEQNELFCITAGVTYKWLDTPDDVKDRVYKIFINDVKAYAAMSRWGKEGDEALKQYVICRFGSFSESADIEKNAVENEYYDCGKKGECPYEGKICKTIKAPYGVISPGELKVLILLCEDMSDKQIASAMNLSRATISDRVRSLCSKIGEATRTGVAVWAVKHGI